MITALMLFNAPLGLLLAAVLLRAAGRRENRLLAAAVLLDAAGDALLGVLLAQGQDPAVGLPMTVCFVTRILVMYPLLGFAYAFRTGDRLSFAARSVALVIVGGAAAAALYPTTAPWANQWQLKLIFFIPFIVVIVRSANRQAPARERDTETGARMLTGALLARFGAEIATNLFVRPMLPELLPTALLLNVIVSMLSYAVLVYAVLRYRLLRVGGAVVQALLYTSMMLLCLGASVSAAELIASHVHDAVARSALFALVALVLLVGWTLVQRNSAALETLMLFSFDSRRRQLNAVLERTLHESLPLVDAAAVYELTSRAISSLCNGEVVLWNVESASGVAHTAPLLGPTVPRALAEHLLHTPESGIHRRALEALSEPAAKDFAALDADAAVPVRVYGTLLCVLAIRGPSLDQDVLDTAKALADNLANKLANSLLDQRASELQSQLDASRRLATLGSFAAAIAHDIRTPLTSIKMNVQMIRARSDIPVEARECADTALDELRRLNDYVSGMLDYVKPVELRAAEFDLWLLIEETARTVQSLLESRKVELRCDPDDARALPLVRADVTRIKQVLVNLLENAVEASRPGGSIHITTSMASADRIAIRLIDHGHGIEPGILERIFEPFFTTRDDGTGLGLSIVKKLVVAHGGAVRVDSVVGEGSTFTVELPAKQTRARGPAVRAPLDAA